jgi:uncharacterized metal-binding protein
MTPEMFEIIFVFGCGLATGWFLFIALDVAVKAYRRWRGLRVRSSYRLVSVYRARCSAQSVPEMERMSGTCSRCGECCRYSKLGSNEKRSP